MSRDWEELRARFWRRRSPVERLLFCCLRDGDKDVALARTSAEDPTLCWRDVLDIAVVHQVTPLVYRSLQRAELVGRVDGDVLAQFRQALLLGMENAKRLETARDDALGFFAERGIDVMLVKGTAMDWRLGAEPWLTVSQDVDLLVRGKLSELAGDVKQRMVAMTETTPPVDVHCERHSDIDMNGLLPIDFEAVFRSASRIDAGGRRAYVMSPEDELVTACVQSFRKRFFRLKSIHEIAWLLAREAIDLERVAARARAWRCAWITYVALAVVEASAGCGLPPNLRKMLGVPRARAGLLHALIARLSLCSLATLYVDRVVRGKRIGRGLLLPYASQGWRQMVRSGRIVAGHMARGERRTARSVP